MGRDDELVTGRLRQLLEKGKQGSLPPRMEVKFRFVDDDDSVPNIKGKYRKQVSKKLAFAR